MTTTVNALMESTLSLFKTELIKPRRPWRTLSDVELATAEWVDWYSHHRLHGEIGHIPPAEYEANYPPDRHETPDHSQDLYRTRNSSVISNGLINMPRAQRGAPAH
jgi:putative transposase